MRNIITIACVFLFVSAATAGQIETVKYNPNDVLVIKAKESYLSIIEFAEDEEVLDGNAGFNEGWSVKKSGNIAYITPKPYLSSVSEDVETGEIVKRKSLIEPNGTDWNTNFFIRTNKRLYIGDLKLSLTKSTYKINMKYPKDEIKKRSEKYKKANKERKTKEIQKDLNRVTVPKNWDYYKKVNKRSADIAPNYVYDDGKFTYFGFDRTKKMPAIFLRDGEVESSTNSNTRRIGKYYVKIVHKTGKVFFLRSGRKLVGILNNSHNKNPSLDFTTTSNKGVKRVLK